MGKMKLYELAKELNLASKDLLKIASENGMEVKSHLSSLDDNQIEIIKKNVSNNISSTETKKSTPKKDSKESEKKSTLKKSSKEEKTIDSKEQRDIDLSKNSNTSKSQKGSPVIIRREVIIEENEKKEIVKKEEKKPNKNPFVQRNDRKDFNIVYRNRPEKPMTVSELFGLNKKKEESEKVQEKEIKNEIKNEEIKPKITETSENEVKTQSQTNIENKTERLEYNNYKNRDVERDNIFKDRRDAGRKDGFRDKRDNFRDGERNRDFRDRNGDRTNNFRDKNGERTNNFRDRNGERNSNFRDRNNGERNGSGFNRDRRNGDRPNGDRQGFNKNNRFGGRRLLDERGIEKNIKDIMGVETIEKESREYNKSIDKQKNNNKFDENRNNKKKSRKGQNDDINQGKLKNLKQHDRLSNMFEDTSEDGMLEYYDLTTQRGRKGKKKNVKDENRNKQKIFKLKEITIPESISVKDLAQELKKTAGEVIMKLMSLGIMATLNNEVDFDTAFLVAEEFGVTAIKKEEIKEEDILFDDSEDKEEELQDRPPVVVVMGHVDHGKTSLLDAIRKTNVIEGEAGGITQAIGAYKVKINDREITFLDTPGHEAFTAMRARGAQITDIAILIVAANDGVMPQTVEAINHAKSANIPIIVAVNKIDLPDANPQKVKEELMQYELVPEEWGGDTIFVEISAKKNINIDQLLEMVLLQADVLELKANPNKQAKGVVIEARLDKGKGAIASLLVQRGKLDAGDTIVVGSTIGRIRSMTNDKGKKVKSAGPSTPVEVMGLTEVPQAGDTFYEVKDEKMAKHLIERRKRQEREKSINAMQAVTLDNLFSQMEKGSLKQLNLIVKADVQGSVEALKQSLEKLSNDEVRVKVIHAAAGAVTESDVTLAKVSNAIIIAFNVRPVATAKQEAEKDEVEIKQYSVIYHAIEDVESAMKGMLDPKFEEELIGTAEVRQVFKISNVGTIAGCMVLTGKIERNAGVRVIRDDVVIHEGKLVSLKRFKDDVKEVAKDFECGIQIEKYNDLKENDVIEAFVMKEIKR